MQARAVTRAEISDNTRAEGAAHQCDLCGSDSLNLYLYHRYGLCARCYRTLYATCIRADLFVAIVNASKASRGGG